MTKKFRSKIAEAMHETVSGLHKPGLIDIRTMREFDRNCLTEVADLSPGAVAALRKR